MTVPKVAANSKGGPDQRGHGTKEGPWRRTAGLSACLGLLPAALARRLSSASCRSKALCTSGGILAMQAMIFGRHTLLLVER